MRVGAVVEAAVGEWAAESFVEEQEEQRNLNPLGGETVGVAGAVALQQTVAFELAQVVAQLVEGVGSVGEVEGGEDGVVDLLGGPAANMAAAMEEDFEQADDAGVVDLDPGVAHRADGDGQGEALQQRKVDVDIEPLRLETGEAGGDGLEALANGIEMVQSLLKTEVGEVVGDQFVAQEGGELFVLLEEGVAAILNLCDRVKAREIELLALLGGELRSQDQGPVVELLADDLRAEFVGG